MRKTMTGSAGVVTSLVKEDDPHPYEQHKDRWTNTVSQDDEGYPVVTSARPVGMRPEIAKNHTTSAVGIAGASVSSNSTITDTTTVYHRYVRMEESNVTEHARATCPRGGHLVTRWPRHKTKGTPYTRTVEATSRTLEDPGKGLDNAGRDRWMRGWGIHSIRASRKNFPRNRTQPNICSQYSLYSYQDNMYSNIAVSSWQCLTQGTM
jgi:hypothetical protein